LSIERPAAARTLSEEQRVELRDLVPEQVFRSLYSTQHPGEVSPELLAAFHDVCAEVEGMEGR
jgi:hypothetical protein